MYIKKPRSEYDLGICIDKGKVVTLPCHNVCNATKKTNTVPKIASSNYYQDYCMRGKAGRDGPEVRNQTDYTNDSRTP